MDTRVRKKRIRRRYNKEQLAKILKLTPDTVDTLKGLGMPREIRSGEVVFDLERVVDWLDLTQERDRRISCE
jgi:phage terminase Nu1 subunit (DNA packaging protein)